jgi:fluoride exporter
VSAPPTWHALLLVAAGGAAGSVARYMLSLWTMQAAGMPRFPLGTFAVNVLGCLLAGVLAGLAARQAWLEADTRLLLMVGVLGGFTTFSAFGIETAQLLRRGEWLLAGGYVAGSVLLGIAAVLLGLWLAAPGAGRA